MRLFRHKYVDRHGRKRESKNIYIGLIVDRREVVIAGLRDEASTTRLGLRLEELVAVKTAGAAMSADLRQWLDGVPRELLERLVRAGLVSERSAASSKSLGEHLGDYGAHLRGKENTEDHVRRVLGHVKRVADACGWRFLGDAAPEGFEAWRAEARETGLAPRTVNSVMVSVKGFFAWAMRHGRVACNPLGTVGRLSEALDKRVRRRALDSTELVMLLEEAASSGAILCGMTGADRRALYALAARTGLRWSEIASLVVADVNISARPFTVTTRASYIGNKAGQDVELALLDEVAEMLAPYVAGKAPGAKLLSMMPKRRAGAELVQADLATARARWEKAVGADVATQNPDFLAAEDSAGRIVDFHALRHSLCSELAKAGVMPKAAMDLARHSDINLTLRWYSHTRLEDRADALRRLPSLTRDLSGRLSATGTDDSVYPICVPEGGQKGGFASQEPTSIQPVGWGKQKPVECLETGVSQRSTGFSCGAREGSRTLTGREARGILSPVRLPIPPLWLCLLDDWRL